MGASDKGTSLRTLSPLAPAYAVALPDRAAVLLFGLAWAPLVGSHPAVMARRRAIAVRATHYVHLGRLGVSVGMARLTAHRRRRSHQHHAAAAVFAACQDAGPVAWLTLLPDGRYWLVAARDGAVLARSDRVFPDLGQGQLAMQGLCSAFPGLEQISDERAWASLTSGLPRITQAAGNDAAVSASAISPGMSLIDALSARIQASDAMIALSWHARVKPLWWACSLPLMACAVWRVLPVISSAPDSALPPAQIISPHDAQARWRGAQVQAMAAHWQGARSFVQVLTRLRGVPVSLAGWQLSAVQCDWARAFWKCRADFDRIDPRATNADFLRMLPDAWHAGFVPLGRAYAYWDVPASSWDEQAKDLPEVAWVDSTLMSLLQHRAPAFTHITIGAPEVLVVTEAPRSETGEPIDAPVTLAKPRRRSIQVQGPLRSFGLIRDVDTHAIWSRVRLTFTPHADVSLNRSALHVELEGWLYEQISA